MHSSSHVREYLKERAAIPQSLQEQIGRQYISLLANIQRFGCLEEFSLITYKVTYHLNMGL